MSKLNAEKLSVELSDGVTNKEPVLARKYTLTHSDSTGELFLNIGLKYAYDKINSKRDEVLGEWKQNDEIITFHAYLEIDNNSNFLKASFRNYIFRKEMPLVLEAIRYGDKELFTTYPKLDNCDILVHFNSKFPRLNKLKNFGIFSDYDIIKYQSS